jgi:hypothetical protein
VLHWQSNQGEIDMTELAQKLTDEVKVFVDGGDPRPMLETMVQLSRTDIYGQAAVRYLMKTGKWQFDAGFEPAIAHLFGHFPERTPLDSATYTEATRQIIKDAWGYEIEAADWMGQRNKMLEEVAARKKTVRTAPSVKAEKPVKESTAKSGSKSFKTLAEAKTKKIAGVDTTLASKRLQKVIAIQRDE